jgi:hypothetical protein
LCKEKAGAGWSAAQMDVTQTEFHKAKKPYWPSENLGVIRTSPSQKNRYKKTGTIKTYNRPYHTFTQQGG